MVEINESLTREVAFLARLELTDVEVKTYTSQLSNVLNYIEKLNEVNVGVDETSVIPLTHPLELKTAFREDEVRPFPINSDGSSKILESAPEVLEVGYKVPAIL